MHINADKVAVITGGASGIGFGLAEALVHRGARVVISDIREDALEPALNLLNKSGAHVVGYPVDVADRRSVEALAAETMRLFGRVDLVCNNAGLISPAAPLWEQDEQTWQRMIGVKLMGVINGTTAFAPHLIAQGRGHILNTASSGGLSPLPSRSPYTATMHAVVGLTETLDLELKQVNPLLGATVLCPGLVDTPLGHNSASLGAITLPPSAARSIRDLGTALTPREVAEAALGAVEAGTVHVAPGEGVFDRSRARVERLLADLAVGVQ